MDEDLTRRVQVLSDFSLKSLNRYQRLWTVLTIAWILWRALLLQALPYERGDTPVELRYLWTFIGFPASVYLAFWYVGWVMRGQVWLKGAVGYVLGVAILLLGWTLADLQFGFRIFMVLMAFGAVFGVIAGAVSWIFAGRSSAD